jgi:hypothetical protein
MIRYTLSELDAMQNKYDLKLGITNELQLLQMQQAHALQDQEVCLLPSLLLLASSSSSLKRSSHTVFLFFDVVRLVLFVRA